MNFQIQKYFGDKEDVETIVLSCLDWWFYHQTAFHFDKKIAIHTVNGSSAVNFLADRGANYIFVDRF